VPRVHLQAPLTQVTGGESVVEVPGRTVGELIDAIEERHGGLKEMIFNERGQLHRHIIISVNEEDVRFLENYETAVLDGDEVSILPVIAGG
jgi:molybdopterin synthase sulfur carrier subunit